MLILTDISQTDSYGILVAITRWMLLHLIVKNWFELVP